MIFLEFMVFGMLGAVAVMALLLGIGLFLTGVHDAAERGWERLRAARQDGGGK